VFAAMNRIAKLVGLAGAHACGEALLCSLFTEGSRQGHFFLRFRLNCTRCISIAPAMLDRYLAALPAMSLIPFAPFFTADFLAPFFALLFESPAAPSPALRPLPMSALAAR
jgi:hypothetical protein